MSVQPQNNPGLNIPRQQFDQLAQQGSGLIATLSGIKALTDIAMGKDVQSAMKDVMNTFLSGGRAVGQYRDQLFQTLQTLQQMTNRTN